MSFDGNGNYTVPPGTAAVTGTPVDSAKYNAFLIDLQTALSKALLRDGQSAALANIPMGLKKLTGLAAGTSSGDAVRWEQLFSQTLAATLASATTTDIGAQNTTAIEITGTTTITGFGTTYNGPRFLRFAGALILTHSAALNLPGAANITTVAGDTCIAIPNAASSGWNVFAFQRAASRAATEAFVNTLMTPPAVMAYQSGTGSTLTNALATRVSFNTERYDTNSCYASPTFTPNVAGIYQISAAVKLPSAAPGFLSIYRNGVEYKRGAWTALSAAAFTFSISGLVECNGSTDYVEIYAYQSSGGSLDVEGGDAITWFDATWQRKSV